MSRLPFVSVLVLTLSASAQAALLQVDITYTNGQILSGPLSADLTELPTSVHATFFLANFGPGDFNLADLVQSSLVFGDAAWSLDDLESFAASFTPQDKSLDLNSLTYAYNPIDTPTVAGRLAQNFPLDIQGTDLATGQAFHYLYDTSMQTLTVVPEPSSIALAALGLAALGVAATARRRRRDGAAAAVRIGV